MSKPSPADADLVLRLYEMRREPELRKARHWFLSEFKAASWEEVGSVYLSGSDADRHYRMVTSYWEMVASMVNRGVLNEDLYFDTTGEHVVVWNRIKEIVPGARAKIRPTYLWNLEQLVRRHLEWRERTYATAAETIEGGSRLGKGPKPPKALKPKKSKKRAR
jgi:hypothetical protein